MISCLFPLGLTELSGFQDLRDKYLFCREHSRPTCTYVLQKGQILGLFMHTIKPISFIYRKSQKIGPHPEVSDTGEVSLGNPAIVCIRDQPSSMV